MTPKWHPSVFGNQPRFFEFEEVKDVTSDDKKKKKNGTEGQFESLRV